MNSQSRCCLSFLVALVSKTLYGSPFQQNTLIETEMEPDACPRLLIEKKSVDSLIEHIGNTDRIEFEVYYDWFALQT
jgi:hypothetical protein